MGVGAGEAGGLPSTHAIVADYFPPERRAKALTAIAVATSIGVVSGLAVGGFVSDRFGWRAAFWVGGAPGLLLAALTLYTLREPGPWLFGGEPEPQKAPGVPIGLAIKHLWRRSSYVFVVLGLSIAFTASYAQQAWMPTFLIRSFGLKPSQVGLMYALSTAIPAMIAMIAGNFIVERWTRLDKRATIWFLLATFAVLIPIGIATFLAPNLYLVIAGIVVYSLINSAYVSSQYTLIQGLAGPKLRATASAIFGAVGTLVPLSVGPAVTGFLSDRLMPAAGVNSLRWALCIVSLFYLASLPFFLLAARTVGADLDEAERA
jgi:MFS family permease